MKGKYITLAVTALVSEDGKLCHPQCPAFYDTHVDEDVCMRLWKSRHEGSTRLRQAAGGGYYRCAACKRAEKQR